MYALEQLKLEAADLLKKAAGLTITADRFSTPPRPELGDLAFPAFELAAHKRQSPKQAAADAAAKIEPAGLVAQVKAEGAYLNFFADVPKLAALVTTQATQADYGYWNTGKGKTVMIEYSQPNPNKPLHVGHLRNTVYGAAVANLLEACGCRVVRANLMNDRGIHICKAMFAYQKWGKDKAPDKKPDHFVGDFYALFEKKARDDPVLEKEALSLLEKWEAGDAPTRALWKKTTDWCYEGFKQTYELFGARFDTWFYESQLYGEGKKLVQEGIRRGVFVKNADGSVEADLSEYGLGKKALLRSDGTSIYATADLELAKQKFEKHALEKSIYCTSSEQQLYFKQLFKMLELLGFAWASKCEHLWHGMVRLPTGKMSSREGTAVNADDLLEEVVALAKREAEKRGASKDIEKTAAQVGVGAVKFAFLSANHQKDIVFEKEKAVSFEGDTGPYVQYAHVRCAAILKKLGRPKAEPDYSLISTLHEKQLVVKLAEFPEAVRVAAQNRETHELAQYLLGLAHAFTTFYENCPVTRAESEALKAGRAQLVLATKNTLKQGLALLGLQAPEQM